MSPVTLKFPKLPWNEIFEFSEKHRVEAELIAAIILQESGGNQFACRYEPKWKYWAEPWIHANNLSCTVATETTGQATSYGYCQIMGAVARELGFKDWFGKLYLPGYNVNLGAAKLSQLLNKHRNPLDVISSYNQGSPKKTPDGKYINHGYVDRVMAFYWELKKPA